MTFLEVGKSTLAGRLLYDLNVIPEQQFSKSVRESYEMGMESFKFAHLIDKTREEKCRGVTADWHIRSFYSQFYHYTLIDTPGCRSFIRNMIFGASQCDCAILMISGDINRFKSSIAKENTSKGSVAGPVRNHAVIAHILGIKQLIVCINQMDSKQVNYSQEAFTEIKDIFSRFLSKIGFKVKKIPFIPISAFKGENIVEPSGASAMDWYQGFSVKIKKQEIRGYTVLDAIDNILKPPKREIDKPFRMSIANWYKIAGIGFVFIGMIEQGTIKRLDAVRVVSFNGTFKVKSIETIINL